MLLTGGSISSEQAFSMGMVNHVCEGEELDNKVNEIVQQILHHSPEVIALGKYNFHKMTEETTLEK